MRIHVSVIVYANVRQIVNVIDVIVRVAVRVVVNLLLPFSPSPSKPPLRLHMCAHLSVIHLNHHNHNDIRSRNAKRKRCE